MVIPKAASAALFLGALGLAACTAQPESDAVRLDPDAVPFELLEPEAAPLLTTTTAVDTDPVALCFVSDGRLRIIETRIVTPVRLTDVVEALSTIPSEAEGMRTTLTDPTVIGAIRLASGIAHVDLRAGISALGGDDQLLAVAQVVCTLTGRPGVGQVTFTLEGSPVDVPRGDGALVSTPLSRDDYAGLLP